METHKIDTSLIRQYNEGTLEPKLMHELEKQALDDPFLADALEGYAQVPAAGHDLSILQRQLHERIAYLQENKKVYDLTWQRLSVAAAAAVLFIAAGLLFWMNSQTTNEKLAQKPAAQTVAPLTNDTPAVRLQRKETVIKPQTKTRNSRPELIVQARKTVKKSKAAKPATAVASMRSELAEAPINSVERDSATASIPLPAESRLATTKQSVNRKESRDSVEMSEVTVRGYGSQKRKDVTGSVHIENTVDDDHKISIQLTGVVRDAKTGEPLPGVSVKEVNTNSGVTTGKDGSYSIAVSQKNAVLAFTYIGYHGRDVNITGNQPLEIALTESNAGLSEVVVVGHGGQPKKPVIGSTDQNAKADTQMQSIHADIGATQPQPASGWARYGEYLRKNNRLLKQGLALEKVADSSAFKTGAVILGFKVLPNGKLADFNIITGLSEKQNAEAIRLVKEGPEWQPAANGTTPQVRVKIPFGY